MSATVCLFGRLSVGVTLPSQASKVVEAVSELLLASGSTLAASTRSHIRESEAELEPVSRLQALCLQMKWCTGLACMANVDITASIECRLYSLQVLCSWYSAG